jgi:uncharacterized protein
MLEIFGFAGALLMGVTLGLIGGGGSILTVPILVYLFNVDPVLATAYSLFIVGFTSLIGTGTHIKQGNVHWKTALYFGIPSIVSVYLTRLFVMPMIPQVLATFGSFQLTKSVFLLLIFSVLMVVAAYTMIRECKSCDEAQAKGIEYNYPMILLEGLVVGGITGLVGAGGGFLIIPALVLLTKLPMKLAVGTSLVIIAAKSLMGFVGDLQSNPNIEWRFLLLFSGIAVVGIIIGSLLSKKIPNEKLKPAFGVFVLIMGIYIISKELFF